jgi:hypothetical protein
MVNEHKNYKFKLKKIWMNYNAIWAYDKLSRISDFSQTFLAKANFVFYTFHSLKAMVIEASVTPAFRLGDMKRLDSGLLPKSQNANNYYCVEFSHNL